MRNAGMKAASKTHSLQATAQDGGESNLEALGSRQREQQVHRSQPDLPRPPPTRGNTVQDSAPGSAHLDLNDEELTIEIPGMRLHAPSPGLRGAPNVSRLGSGPTATEREDRYRQILEGQGKGPPATAMREGRGRKESVVAVTSSRELALSDERAKALAWAGGVMLVMSSMLFILMLVAWRGVNFSLFSSFSPWLGVYLPIPLGLLNGGWSLHCAKCGHILLHSGSSCASRGGMCGTAWGCSGPSCALNLGLDLGLLITALLAALPAGASAKGCDYDCIWLLCFPCAPGGGEGVAALMVLTTLGLAFAVGFKMWMMTSALLSGQTLEQIFLPW